jgi:drug/metabolite transporter (DMT)-like permease
LPVVAAFGSLVWSYYHCRRAVPSLSSQTPCSTVNFKIMQSKVIQANFLMLLAAAIWGFAFVAQRVGMESMGPHLFNGIRFIIGALVLLPLILWLNCYRSCQQIAEVPFKYVLLGGLVAGVFLFAGASLQQVGLQYTTAGKAGFITGLYIFFVPLIGLLFGQRTGLGTWLGAVIALYGLYLLSIGADFTLAYGDGLELMCAVMCACHVLVIGYLARRMDTVMLSLIQFAVAGVMSLVVALLVEPLGWNMVVATAIPLLYAGVISTGVAYTLQVVAQQYAHPSHAAIILSSEGLFAVLGGWLLLSEHLSERGLIGCALMLVGMLLSQLMPRLRLPWPRAV